jgi:phospholipid/cholesterol/gamma-HCH transport system substrate-binding protein
MAFRIKHADKIVGVFLTFVIMVIVVIIIFIGRERRWFEEQFTFTTKFRRGEGLSAGMQATIKGIQVGEVKRVYLNEDNWIEVTFTVYKEYTPRIRKDSVVDLKSPLIGGKSLEIIPGAKDMPALAKGSYIWSRDTDEGQLILQERQREDQPDEITRILKNVELLTYNLSAADGNLNETLDRIQYFFTMLSSKEGSLNKTLASLENITSSIGDKEGSVGKLLQDDFELYNSTIALMTKLNGIMDDVKTLSAGLSSLSPDIKAAVERSNITMNEAIGLIRTLQDNFFIKAFSPKQEDKPTSIEGAEREGGYR